MALSIGIVGLPNVGKSTLFNALTKAQNAEAANYPSCTIEPNKATVPVPDARVDALTELVKPAKTIYATVDFIDIAGLVRGAARVKAWATSFWPISANVRQLCRSCVVLKTKTSPMWTAVSIRCAMWKPLKLNCCWPISKA